MKRSTDSILTTHVGSLPRPADLLETMLAREAGKKVDEAALGARVAAAVDEVVQKQASIGLDVVDDGEHGKASFLTYINARLSGFEPGPPRGNVWQHSREGAAFPEFYAEAAAMASGAPGRARQMVCTEPVRYAG